jgi:hypothetical protein
MMDDESERSYAGSLAERYYELKDEREERKRELLEERRTIEKEREKQMKFERAKEDEVYAAYKSFKKARRRARKEGRKIPIDSIVGQEFTLYSSDYVDKYTSEFGETPDKTRRVNFYYLDECDISWNAGKSVGEEDKSTYVEGQVYLDSDAECTFSPIRLPTYARRKDMKLKSDDGKYALWFKFFGNGYLKLSISRNFLFEGRLGSSSATPEMFDFVGIWRDWEKEKKEMAEKHERRAKNRAPSPRESWFEMNHPMGSWNQMGW